MTTGIERPVASLAACAEIAERLIPELGHSLRWLATHPSSGAILIIEGFVRDDELMLVVDMPGGPDLGSSRDVAERHGRVRKECGSRRSTSETGKHHGLLSLSVSLARDEPEPG